MEIWKAIEGYEGLYEISNYGRVKSLKRKRILKQCLTYKGYCCIGLYKNNKFKSFLVHRLVAMAFIQNPNKFPIINHKDENKANNHVDNLEWCTHKYNTNYGTGIKRKNEKCLKPIKCVETNIIYSSASELKKLYGYHTGLISDVCNGKRQHKTAYGYHWEYVA